MCDSLSDLESGSVDFTYTQETGVTSIDYTFSDLLQNVEVSEDACFLVSPYLEITEQVTNSRAELILIDEDYEASLLEVGTGTVFSESLVIRFYDSIGEYDLTVNLNVEAAPIIVETNESPSFTEDINGVVYLVSKTGIWQRYNDLKTYEALENPTSL